MNHLSLGKAGEQLAVDYLHRQGYQIIERNFRTRNGEIDIIAKQASFLVFVEVKTRRSLQYGQPAEAVTYRKQQKLIQTALLYLQESPLAATGYRFDVMEIFIDANNNPHFHHIPNAFYLS